MDDAPSIKLWEGLFKKLDIPYRKRSTGALYILCPFHKEKTASLRVWPDSGKFLCFGCHKGETMVDFVDLFFNLGDKPFAERKIREICGGLRAEYDPDQLIFLFMAGLPTGGQKTELVA